MKNPIKYSMKTTLILWVLQLAVVIVLLPAVYSKLVNMGVPSPVFDMIEMGELGRIFIGVIELLTVIMLLSWRFAASGSVLGMAVMLGAIIAHITVLGVHTISFALLLFILCFAIFVIRRKEVPLIGDQL